MMERPTRTGRRGRPLLRSEPLAEFHLRLEPARILDVEDLARQLGIGRRAAVRFLLDVAFAALTTR